MYNKHMRLHFNFEIKEVLYMKKFKRLTACVLALAMLCGCASGTDAEQNVTFDSYYETTNSEQKTKTLQDSVTVALPLGELNLNPLLATDKPSKDINALLFDSLVEYDQKGNLTASLATYSVSDDKLSYTFSLKEAYFASGAKLTVDDVIFSIKVMCYPTYRGPYDFANSNITGALEFNRNEALEIVGLEKVGDNILTIHLDSPNSEFLSLMTFGVLSKDSYSGIFTFDSTDALPASLSSPDGCGQYYFDKQDEDGSIYLKANERYHKGAPIIKNVKVIKSDDTVQSVIDAQADIAYMPAEQDTINKVAQSGSADMYKLVGDRFVGFGFNCTGVFADENTRQAIAYILNAHNIFEQNKLPFAKTMNSLQSLDSPSYRKIEGEKYEFSLEKAEETLKSVGFYKDGSGKLFKDGEPFVISIVAQSGNSFIEITLNEFKSEIKKLGIELNVEYLSEGEISQRIAEKSADCFFTTFDLPTTQSAFEQTFKTGGRYNVTGFSSSKLDNLFADYKSATSKDEQSKISTQILLTLNSQLPIIPIYQCEDLWLVNGDLKDFTASFYSNIFENMYKLKFE